MDIKEHVKMVLDGLMGEHIRIDSLEVSNPLNKVEIDGKVRYDKNEIYITIRAYKNEKETTQD